MTMNLQIIFTLMYCASSITGTNNNLVWYDLPDYKPVQNGKGFKEVDKLLIVDFHNAMRRNLSNGKFYNMRRQQQPIPTNVGELKWSDELERQAQGWADKCNEFHGDTYGGGQNLLFTTNIIDGLRDMNKWNQEYYAYKYNKTGGYSIDSSKVGHYTQVISAHSTEVGCGATICNDGLAVDNPDKENRTFTKKTINVVCNYFPAGNIYENPPYTIGTPCEGCTPYYSKCDSGLICSNKCTFGKTCTDLQFSQAEMDQYDIKTQITQSMSKIIGSGNGLTDEERKALKDDVIPSIRRAVAQNRLQPLNQASNLKILVWNTELEDGVTQNIKNNCPGQSNGFKGNREYLVVNSMLTWVEQLVSPRQAKLINEESPSTSVLNTLNVLLHSEASKIGCSLFCCNGETNCTFNCDLADKIPGTWLTTNEIEYYPVYKHGQPCLDCKGQCVDNALCKAQ